MCYFLFGQIHNGKHQLTVTYWAKERLHSQSYLEQWPSIKCFYQPNSKKNLHLCMLFPIGYFLTWNCFHLKVFSFKHTAVPPQSLVNHSSQLPKMDFSSSWGHLHSQRLIIVVVTVYSLISAQKITSCYLTSKSSRRALNKSCQSTLPWAKFTV